MLDGKDGEGDAQEETREVEVEGKGDGGENRRKTEERHGDKGEPKVDG